MRRDIMLRIEKREERKEKIEEKRRIFVRADKNLPIIIYTYTVIR